MNIKINDILPKRKWRNFYAKVQIDTENIMPSTLTSVHAGIDWNNMQHPRQNDYTMIEKSYEEGILTQLDRHLPGMSQIGDTLGYLNGGHVYQLNALKCKNLTDGMMFGRKIVQEYAKMYRKYVPGCENMETVNTSSIMGIRESRRIAGEYELTYEDYRKRRSFPDQIGVFNKFVDIHPYNDSLEEQERLRASMAAERLQRGEFFGIPYGVLVPKGWKNLWVAGRCVSSDIKVQGCIRVMPSSSMMGQAAGTAAVQSIKTGQAEYELNTKTLVKTLRERGAFLPQEELSEVMTRTKQST